MKNKIVSMVLGIAFLFTLGCGSDLPFEYRYLSANVVQIQYIDKIYELDRFGEKVDTPFDYDFEPDGDLDITIGGKAYDIDSPYDIDKKKKTSSTTKKLTSKKTTKKKKL